MSDKIINTFQQRRQLAQELADLAQTTSEAELLDAVRRMARSYPSDLLAAALVKQLDTSNSQVRGGLGHLATLLPPEEIAPALRSAAANRQHSPQTRVTAALLLERFLGESVPPALLGDLSQSNEVAFQSLREAVDEGRRNRHIFLEYVTQMHQAGEPVVYMVMELLERLPPADRVELYRLIALGERPGPARMALQRLERLATVDRELTAARALHSLQFTLPPETAAQVERALRKLAFAGARYTPPPATGWRALLSPVDVSGSYSLWLVQMPSAGQSEGVLMGLVLNATQGIVQAFASETMPAEQLPRPHAEGQLVSVRTDNGGVAVLLEAPWDFCRWRLLAIQAMHWQGAQTRPMPGEYQLYQDRIWEFAAPQPDLALAVYFQEDAANALSDLPVSLDELDDAATELLAHPAMTGWGLHHRLFLQTFASASNALANLPLDELAAYLLRALAQRPESAQLAASWAAGLRAQAAWLHIAGNLESAHRAHLLARSLSALPLNEHPFIARLVANSLRATGMGA
jgi:hypothetical protein